MDRMSRFRGPSAHPADTIKQETLIGMASHAGVILVSTRSGEKSARRGADGAAPAEPKRQLSDPIFARF